MKAASATVSLGARLSWWLAAQSLIVFLIASTLVYLASASSHAQRQAESLSQKQVSVQHLLSEAAAEPDLSVLIHKLDDLFLGHDDLRIRLQGPAGAVIYSNGFLRSAPSSIRGAAFESLVPINGQAVSATLELDTSADQEMLARLAWTLVGSVLLGSALISAGGFVLVRTGLWPVRGLIRQIDELDAGTLLHRLDGSHQPRELQPLIDRFNGLLDRLEAAQDQLEDFNANVAHELCTPLATLITATEVVLRRPHSAQAHREVLESNLEDLHRLTAIVTDMLFLSRADRGAKSRNDLVESLAELCVEVADYHSAAAEDAGVGFSVLGDTRLRCDAGLLRRALSNLLANATRYAERGSEIVVNITPKADGVELAVSNRGANIAPEHQLHLFDRFYRADPSRTKAGEHHGLGLAIVAAIAQMHGGQAFVRSAQGVTTVGLKLPTLG